MLFLRTIYRPAMVCLYPVFQYLPRYKIAFLYKYKGRSKTKEKGMILLCCLRWNVCMYFWTIFQLASLCIISCLPQELEKQPPAVLHQKVLKNLAIFTGKQLCWSLIFNKVEIKKETLLKKRLQDRCFPVNIAKFLKTSIFKNICKRLLQGWNQMENILY